MAQLGIIWADGIWNTATWNTAIWSQVAGPANNAPTDIELSKSTVRVDAGLNGVVGILTATDPDAGDTITFSLVAGAGSTNNASFNISGSTLRCNDPLTLGVGAYSIRIRATDAGALTYEEVFEVTVTAVPVTSGRGVVRSAVLPSVRAAIRRTVR